MHIRSIPAFWYTHLQLSMLYYAQDSGGPLAPSLVVLYSLKNNETIFILSKDFGINTEER